MPTFLHPHSASNFSASLPGPAPSKSDRELAEFLLRAARIDAKGGRSLCVPLRYGLLIAWFGQVRPDLRGNLEFLGGDREDFPVPSWNKLPALLAPPGAVWGAAHPPTALGGVAASIGGAFAAN